MVELVCVFDTVYGLSGREEVVYDVRLSRHEFFPNGSGAYPYTHGDKSPKHMSTILINLCSRLGHYVAKIFVK